MSKPIQPDEEVYRIAREIVEFEFFKPGNQMTGAALIDKYAQQIATHSKKQELRARIDEANGVQLAYNHMLAQTHASGSWQSMTDRREDLKAQLTALEGDAK